MNQEEIKENTAQTEGATGKAEAEAAANVGEIDNLPVESIGSYARVEELLTDEEAEDMTGRNSGP